MEKENTNSSQFLALEMFEDALKGMLVLFQDKRLAKCPEYEFYKDIIQSVFEHFKN